MEAGSKSLRDSRKKSHNRAPHEHEKWRFLNNHTIERAVSEKISPLDDGEKECMLLKKK